MKIIYYSQHIWGVGHVFRTLEICKALQDCEVILVTGGDRVDVQMPANVRECRLPGIMTNRNPKDLVAMDQNMSLEQVRRQRKQMLHDIYASESPDVWMIEFYPFGRNAFRFELDPLLDRIRKNRLPQCLVVSSLRDILVEKANTQLYELRVIHKLNRYFDALLIHSDPNLVKLDETFSRMDKIAVPVVYTGFVATRPVPDARSAIREMLGIGDDAILIVASCGGGKAGAPLMKAAIEASQCLRPGLDPYLYVFAGPYMAAADYERLRRLSDDRVRVARFTDDFLSYLAAADVSISMGGYNTCMNLLSSGVKALVWPFSFDREQGLRAQRLARRGILRVLRDTDLDPERMADVIHAAMEAEPVSGSDIDLDGADRTAGWLRSQVV